MPPIQTLCQSVLCLDFDGVLHRGSDAIHVPSGAANVPLLVVQLKAQSRLTWLKDLEQMLEASPGVAILVHSTWRRRFSQSTLAQLLGGLESRVVQPPAYAVDLTAPAPAFIRQSLDWINETRHEAGQDSLNLQHCVVLDDRPEFFAEDAEMFERLVVTDPNRGLGDASKRRELLVALKHASAHRHAVVFEDHGDAAPVARH
ncbi:HAD domain-containing protein [Variovorax gossypii]|uniref:HAD domain-containing protein n=1 Tax=uncultured Variovorax sp. TaxID=114708 RepID=UPI00261E7CD4|nr:HAD domain-containing protein [uncultured Variovorax sp.]